MFKIGDKVKRTKDNWRGMFPGDIGTVVAIGKNNDIAIKEYGGSMCYHTSSNFILVSPKIIKQYGIVNFMKGTNV